MSSRHMPNQHLQVEAANRMEKYGFYLSTCLESANQMVQLEYTPHATIIDLIRMIHRIRCHIECIPLFPFVQHNAFRGDANIIKSLIQIVCRVNKHGRCEPSNKRRTSSAYAHGVIHLINFRCHSPRGAITKCYNSNCSATIGDVFVRLLCYENRANRRLFSYQSQVSVIFHWRPSK